MKRECVSRWTFSQQQPPTEWCSRRLVWVSLVLTLRVIRIELLHWIIPFQSNNSTWPAKTCCNYCNSPQYFETWKFAVKRSLWHVTLSYRTFILVTLGKFGAHHLELCCLFTASLGYEVIFLPTTLCHAFHEVHLQASRFFTLGSWCAAVSRGSIILQLELVETTGDRCFFHGKTREPHDNFRYGTFECEYATWPRSPFRNGKERFGSRVFQEIYDPQVKFAKPQSSGKVANRDMTTTFLATSHKLRHISTSTISVGLNDKRYLVDHTCLWSSKLSQPQPLQLRYNESVIWFHNYDTHTSDTKSYLLSKYMFHHILVTHGYEIHIHLPNSTQFKCAFNHFAVCSKCSLPWIPWISLPLVN